MARPMKPLVRSGGYYPSNRWTPLVYPGGYTTANGGGQPEPEAVLKTVTGSLIHITDALALPAKALSANISPIQNLHGYDSPWPAGGGKNKLPYATPIEIYGVNFAVSSDGVVTLNGTSNAGLCDCYFVGGANARYDYAPIQTGEYILSGAAYGTTLYIVAEGGTIIAQVLGGQSATVTLDSSVKYRMFIRAANGQSFTNVKVYPMLRLSSVSDATYAPYSNICPISGRTSATVTRTGKNLLPNVSGKRDSNSVFIGQSDGSTYPTHLKAGVTYAISFTTNVGSGFVYMKENGGSNILFGISGGTYTPASDMAVQMWVYQNGLTSVSNFQLEVGSATAYEPYIGTTYPIPLGQTVYGGTLDVTSGKLTVDRAMVDMGTLSWNGWETDGVYIFYATIIGKVQSRASVCISSQYVYNKYVSVWTNLLNAQMTGANGNANIYIKDNRYSSISDFSTAMDGVQLVYELATPIFYDLTPTEVSTLLGENNLWSDSNGDLTLTYLADGNASEIEALNILLGNRYYNNHESDEPTDREALDIVLGGKK